MNQRQKHTLIAAIVALLGLVLILSVIWFSNAENRLKSYYSKKYGFTIKYPSTWAMQEGTNETAVVFISPKQNDLDFFQENVNIVVQDLTPNPMGLADYTDIALGQMEMVFGNNFVLVQSKRASVAGMPGHKVIFVGKGPDSELKFMCLWMVRDLTAYQILYTALSSQYDTFERTAARMMRSFRLE